MKGVDKQEDERPRDKKDQIDMKALERYIERWICSLLYIEIVMDCLDIDR